MSKDDVSEDITRCIQFVSNNEDPKIVLLREVSVIQYLFGDTTFLLEIDKKNKKGKKELEDEWGREILKKRRLDLKLNQLWTGKFGEHICEEIYTLLGKVISMPKKIDGKKPDLEIDDAIVEVKTQTFYTSGTAGEKIVGTPFKYAEIPRLYGKKLLIICVAGAEKVCREEYGNLPGIIELSSEKKLLLSVYSKLGIEFIGASDLLKLLS